MITQERLEVLLRTTRKDDASKELLRRLAIQLAERDGLTKVAELLRARSAELLRARSAES